MQRRQLGFVAAALLTLAACSSSDNEAVSGATDVTPATSGSSTTTSTTATASTTAAAQETTELDAEIRPGVEQLAVLDASPGLELELSTSATRGTDDTNAAGIVDEFGSLLFRELDAADTYYLV